MANLQLAVKGEYFADSFPQIWGKSRMARLTAR
ncbi:hypothetical protein AWP66_19230 [Escherichia coli]|nr:hypothetical protein AWP66_19230 [Escherichia coli]